MDRHNELDLDYDAIAKLNLKPKFIENYLTQFGEIG